LAAPAPWPSNCALILPLAGGSMKITFGTGRSLKVAVATLGVLLLIGPDRADSFITFNDSFADDHVEVTFAGIAFTNFKISPNCTFSLADSKATCSETSPIDLQAMAQVALIPRGLTISLKLTFGNSLAVR